MHLKLLGAAQGAVLELGLRMRVRLLCVACLVMTACEGLIALPSSDQPGPSTTSPQSTRELPAPSARVSRLSLAMYENAARDLLGLPTVTGLSATFVGDTTSGVFDNLGDQLRVGADQWGDFQRGAEELARLATLSPAALAPVAGGSVPGSTGPLIEALGRRVLRRPLTSSEASSYQALFTEGASLYPAMTAQLAGARVVLEALFQSPHFLYRLELADQPVNGVVPLAAHELAARLAFALWQSTPDQALLAAADDGSLLTASGYAAQVDRLLLDGRAREAVRSFHAQLLQVQRYADLTRATTLFPEFVPELRSSMRVEHERFVQAVVFDDRAGLAALLTAPYSFVDAPLARVYGLTGSFGTSPSKVTFTDGRRGGLLTQAGFLAANATSTEPDPIHRGVFINHRLLCANLPPPPGVVPPLPRPDPQVKKTLRARITEFTGDGTCGEGCHSTMINPIGFAFEHYDALGRWRDLDNGLPVDAADGYLFASGRRAFDGARELGEVLALEDMTHRCYAQHWLEYLSGRAAVRSDKAVITRVATASRAEALPVLDLIRALVSSETFTTRAVETP